ncbi:hypothetical protein [Cryobacterium sp. TMS1-13-1]|nr:hypothetical protein [Cryobacterium sp. TMS1-13-1]
MVTGVVLYAEQGELFGAEVNIEGFCDAVIVDAVAQLNVQAEVNEDGS